MPALTPFQFANRLRSVLEPGKLYRLEGALRAIRCAPVFARHSPEAVLAAAWKAGWLRPQAPYPEDFFLCAAALPINANDNRQDE